MSPGPTGRSRRETDRVEFELLQKHPNTYLNLKISLEVCFISTLSPRYLRNGLTPDEGTRSAPALLGLLPSENRRARKGWVRRVPATAVIPAPRVVVTIIGLKAPVAGLVCPR